MTPIDLANPGAREILMSCKSKRPILVPKMNLQRKINEKI